ncbi:hypothetical protein ScPMuIL_011810 [Solemya velum]
MLRNLFNRPSYSQAGWMPPFLVVNVRFNSSSTCQIQLDLEEPSKVRTLKERVSRKLDIPAEEIQIILAGRIIEDDHQLQDFSVGNETILHAFREKRKPRCPEGVPDCSLEPTRSSSQNNIYQYFVFCHECKSMKPGKLRVRCAVCREGHMILERDPQNWDDVLLPGRIRGECRGEACGTDQRAEFYFKCTGHLSSQQESAVVLKHVCPNRKAAECIACTHVSTPVLVFPCQRNHVICLDCFKSYGIVFMDTGQFESDPLYGYSLPCPDKCENSLIQESHHFCLLGQDQYERYKNLGALDFVRQNGVVCPHFGCGEGIQLEAATDKVMCPSCKFLFCRQCLSEWHEGPCRMRCIQLPEVFPINPQSKGGCKGR